MNLLATLGFGLAASLVGNIASAQASCESNWLPVFGGGNGMNGSVIALMDFDDGSGGGATLHAAGDFTTAGGVTANHVAKWDGSNWSALGSGLGGSAYSMAVFDDGSGGGPDLYVGGFFSVAGSAPANNIASWDGTSWSPLGSGTDASVLALEVFDDGLGGGPVLYAGGFFQTAGGVVTNGLAKWDGSSWSGVPGLATRETITSLMSFDDGSGTGPSLYVGAFASSSLQFSNAIARWDGTNWWALGSGLHGNPIFPSMMARVGSFAVFDDGGGDALFVGGYFTAAGSVYAENIAKWDGTSWTTLGSGITGVNPPVVHSLASFDDGGGPALYAGGNFPRAGLGSASNIAKWDGSTWSAIGSGTDSSVFAFRVFDDGGGSGTALFAGGQFTSAGGLAADRVGKLGRSTPVTRFCTAKTGLVCGPIVQCATGLASATATSGFVIQAQPVRGCRAGLLLYSNQPIQTGVGFGGPGNGLLCLSGMGVRRAGPIESGGTLPSTCDGVLAIDLNRFASQNWTASGCNPPPGQNNPAGFLSNMGTGVNAQMWGRDSVATGQLLSDGIGWVVGP